MLKAMMTSCLMLAGVLCIAAEPAPVRAETPACTCSASSVTASVPQELSCLQVEQQSLDVCYGRDVVVRVTNSCSFDVVVKAVPELSGSGSADRTIVAGEEDAWQQVFTPTLSSDGDTTVSLDWTIEADGASHPMELTFVGACAEPTGEEGCQGGANSSSPWAAGGMVLLLLLLLRRRWSEPRQAPARSVARR